MKKIKINRKIELKKSFKISRMKEVIKPTVPHKHDGYNELIYLTDGAGTHIIDEEDYSVEPPMLFCMRAGNVHCWEFSKIPKGYVCIFKEEFLREHPEILERFNHFATKYSLIGNKLNLRSEFEMLMSEFEREEPNPNILKAYLTILLWRISELPQVEREPSTTTASIFNNYKRLVDENYIDEKGVDFYAERLKISKRTLNSICQRVCGRSALSLINERVVEECKRLIKFTDNSISQIAYHLNFSDPSYFVKFFKSKTNLTPGEFRERIK